MKHEILMGSLLALSLGAIPFVSQLASASPEHHPGMPESMPASAVYAPVVPSQMEFAGQTVSLDPIDMAERMDRELTTMSYTHGNMLMTIKRANRIFPQIVPILKQNNIPVDFVYLAAIESYLNPKAISPAGAAGMWQFMSSTAKEYGLEVNSDVDERYDVEKSTRAAARYLRNAYSKYGNWESVAASYNGGMGRISSELSSQQVDSAYDLWLADETMRYLFRLLAMKQIMEHPADYGFRLLPEQLYQPVEYKSYTVNGPVDDWQQWAKEHDSDYRTLRQHNLWIRSKSLPNKSGKTYTVVLPVKEKSRRSKQKTEIYNPAWVTTLPN